MAGKRGDKAYLKWTAFGLYVIAGGGFAVAFLQLFMALIQWGTNFTAGWLGMTLTVVVVAIGWWAMDGVVASVKDVLDGVPDAEAFRSALLLPTTIPVGFGALWTLFTNPQGFPTGLGALILSGVGGYFMHRILKKISGISTGAKVWHWTTAILCVMVGVMHVPAFVYINDWINGWLGDVRINFWIIDIGLITGLIWGAIGAATVLIAWAVGDNLKGDKLPGWPTWWAAMYSIPVYTALGVIALSGFQTGAEAVFTAFS